MYQSPPQQQYQSPPPQQYQSPPPHQGYGGPPPGPPPGQQYGGGGGYGGAPPPPFPPGMPEDLPPLPHGWIALHDAVQQRWYYGDKNTGRTQWERPIDHSQGGGDRGHGGGGYGHDQSRGYGGGYGGAPQYGGPQYGGYPQQHGGEYKDKGGKDNKKLMMGAAGGLAAGAVGGALLASALGTFPSARSFSQRPFPLLTSQPPSR